MKKLIIIACGALAAGTASLAVAGEAAAAPDESGQTYANAKAALLAANYNPVVSSVVGDALPRDECIVVNQQTTQATPFYGGAGPRGGMILGSGNPKVMLSLDCNPHPK
jgi:hypothetical protein